MSFCIVPFNRFIITIPYECMEDCSAQGRVDEAVQFWLSKSVIQNELKQIPDFDLMAELKEYGAWNEIELLNRDDNEARILWIAAGNYKEEIA